MGLSDYRTDAVRLAASPLESARFGFLTDRLTVGVGALAAAGSLASLASLVEAELAASTARVTILRYPSALVGLLRDIDIGEARVYPAGALLYWEAPAALPTATISTVVEIHPGERVTIEGAILDVLRDSFRGYKNHYSANPLIADDVVVEGYAEWALSTLRRPGSRIFVSLHDSVPVGVAIVASSSEEWEIELASISSDFQSRGLYLELVTGLLRTAHVEGARVVISTQAHNIAVQRAWAKLGFRPAASIDTAHIVRPEAEFAR